MYCNFPVASCRTIFALMAFFAIHNAHNVLWSAFWITASASCLSLTSLTTHAAIFSLSVVCVGFCTFMYLHSTPPSFFIHLHVCLSLPLSSHMYHPSFSFWRRL